MLDEVLTSTAQIGLNRLFPIEIYVLRLIGVDYVFSVGHVVIIDHLVLLLLILLVLMHSIRDIIRERWLVLRLGRCTLLLLKCILLE